MSEQTVVDQTPAPRTRASLAADLRALGIQPAETLLVHSSLRALGWVAGGTVAVIQALQDVLTPAGTLVMPAHSGEYGDPANWQNPPVPPEWVPIIRAERPLFDPDRTPTRQMGAIAELFRTWPEVRRSHHPTVSFAAWGAHAAVITDDHSFHRPLGEGSPLARIYELDGRVLLLGVGYDRNTSFHLAEERLPGAPVARDGTAIMQDGRRVWASFEDATNLAFEGIDDSFPVIGAALEQAGLVTSGRVGSAESRLFQQRTAVDFALNWMKGQQLVDST